VSNQLFSDLQAEFRETKKKDAELYRMKIEFEINNKKQEFAQTIRKLKEKNNEELQTYKQQVT
jgi:hypothetical protein